MSNVFRCMCVVANRAATEDIHTQTTRRLLLDSLGVETVSYVVVAVCWTH